MFRDFLEKSHPFQRHTPVHHIRRVPPPPPGMYLMAVWDKYSFIFILLGYYMIMDPNNIAQTGDRTQLGSFNILPPTGDCKVCNAVMCLVTSPSTLMSNLILCTLDCTSTRARTRCGQDAESNFVNPHSFRNLSAYSWKIPLTVFIPSGLIPRTQYKGNNDSYTCPRTECRNDNLLPQPFLILSAL